MRILSIKTKSVLKLFSFLCFLMAFFRSTPCEADEAIKVIFSIEDLEDAVCNLAVECERREISITCNPSSMVPEPVDMTRSDDVAVAVATYLFQGNQTNYLALTAENLSDPNIVSNELGMYESLRSFVYSHATEARIRNRYLIGSAYYYDATLIMADGDAQKRDAIVIGLNPNGNYRQRRDLVLHDLVGTMYQSFRYEDKHPGLSLRVGDPSAIYGSSLELPTLSGPIEGAKPRIWFNGHHPTWGGHVFADEMPLRIIEDEVETVDPMTPIISFVRSWMQALANVPDMDNYKAQPAYTQFLGYYGNKSAGIIDTHSLSDATKATLDIFKGLRANMTIEFIIDADPLYFVFSRNRSSSSNEADYDVVFRGTGGEFDVVNVESSGQLESLFSLPEVLAYVYAD